MRTGFVVRERDVRKLGYAIDGIVQRFTPGGWGAYLRLLDAHALKSPVWQSMLNSILIGETYMFRHAQQFDFLGDEILKSRKGPVRCWSAGCSTGEEAFTMSILFHEKGHHNVEIVASDISVVALEAAAQGRVTVRRGVHEERIAPWMIQKGDDERGRDSWYVVDSVRSSITWEWGNLIEADEIVSKYAPFDVIMCRNVLIYFRDEAVDTALSIFDKALAPDGWLILGHAESLLFRKTAFRMVADGLAYTRVPRQSLAKQQAKAVAAPPPPPPEEETPGVIIKRAVALEQKNRLVDAANILRKLLHRHDDAIMARLTLSGIYRRTGQTDAAEAELTRLAKQLAGRPDDETVPDSDGLTVGALRGFVMPFLNGG